MFRQSHETTLDPKLEQLYAEVSREVFGPPKTVTNSTLPPSNNALMRLVARSPNASLGMPPPSRRNPPTAPGLVPTAVAIRPARCDPAPS